MGWKDLFKKKAPPAPDPLHGLTLDTLKSGYILDYDMRTWEVTAYNTYEWGEGDVSKEWQLVSSDDIIYLEREMDDEVSWSVNRTIDFKQLGPEIRSYILKHDDPPDEIQYDGVTYYMEESAGGHFRKDGVGPQEELIRWSYMDEAEERYLTIEQWGEDEFEASTGIPAEEYQFSNILPRQPS